MSTNAERELQAAAAESFKPIAIRPPDENWLLFFLRCIVDLQLLTTFRFLRGKLPACKGRVLDVGAGQSPWRGLLRSADYVGIDVESAGEFGMARQQDIVYYDGVTIPFAEASFDHVLCSEVLEHVPAAEPFLAELHRVLRPGGSLVLTIPWSARTHHLPHDYRRLTRNGLTLLVEAAGFSLLGIEERGNDVTVVANKLIVMTMRLLRPRSPAGVIWAWPLAALLMPVTASFLVAAHVALRFGLGAREDPLGYGLLAIKR